MNVLTRFIKKHGVKIIIGLLIVMLTVGSLGLYRRIKKGR